MIEKFAICGYARISVDLFEDKDNTSIENQKAIIEDYVRTRFPGSTLDIFVDRDRSGYTFEQLIAGKEEWRDLLHEVDVLVDGPFLLEKRTLECKFRGSSNQRLIDVQASLKAGSPVTLE